MAPSIPLPSSSLLTHCCFLRRLDSSGSFAPDVHKLFFTLVNSYEVGIFSKEIQLKENKMNEDVNKISGEFSQHVYVIMRGYVLVSDVLSWDSLLICRLHFIHILIPFPFSGTATSWWLGLLLSRNLSTSS